MDTTRKLNVLMDIARQLNQTGVIWAVGGSMLLFFKGIVSEFQDIDLMVKPEDAEAVRAILERMGTPQPPKASSRYKSKAFYEFIIDGVDVDVMAGFVIVKDGTEYDRSLRDHEITEYIQLGNAAIPLHSLGAWRRNYELMEKPDKVRLIDRKTQ